MYSYINVWVFILKKNRVDEQKIHQHDLLYPQRLISNCLLMARGNH